MHIQSVAFKSIRQLNPTETDHPGYDEAARYMPNVQLSTVNLVIGENGAGKSTLIDMIRALRWPAILPSLARDNPEYGCTPEFCVQFADNSAYLYRFVPAAYDDSFQKILCKLGRRGPSDNYFEKLKQKNLFRFKEMPEKDCMPSVYPHIEYLNCGGDSLNVSAAALEYLNAHASLLTGMVDWTKPRNPDAVPVDGNAMNALTRDVVSTYLRVEDPTGQPRMDMPNNVSARAYPSGWKACAAILHWLDNVQKGSICLLEEPEVHIHPKLQRRMFQAVLEIAGEKGLQLVISTHSAALINSAASQPKVKILQAQGQTITEANIARTLERLGYQAADLLQANCVIWVEGPSDRLYVRSWLNAKDPALKEGIHYSIMFYGGRLFSHLSADASTVADLISLRRLNRNSAIIFDSDKADPSTKLKGTKRRLSKEFSKGDGNSLVWVTSGREIENYLDEAALVKTIKVLHKKTLVRMVESGRWANLLKYEVDPKKSKAKHQDPQRTANKVAVATHYLNNNKVRFDVLNLDKKLKALCAFIRASNA